ncbi:MAG TPA: 50S ribosomal protein L9 [Polyangiaceae bacterium]|nr:50S ribosomal protein L9 [Polyangiaceae bacterium]
MATNVKVLLQADVDNLGTGGEVVRVRSGFARNYLLPRGLALPATAGNLTRVEELKRAAAQRAQQEREKAAEVASKLNGLTLKLSRAVGEEGKMYGSVTAKDIADAAARAGTEIDRKRIALADPIKQLGTFEVPVKLHPEVTATLKVEVSKS